MTAVVSGAASGIGAATARRFLARGCAVVGLDRKPFDEWDLPSAVDRRRVDLTDAAAVSALFADVGAVSHVASIAGGSDPRERTHLHDPAGLPGDVLAASWTANVRTHHHLLHAAHDTLVTTDGDASFTVCGSVAATRSIGLPGYSSAKAALAGWAISSAVPLAREGIRVNVVAPGTVHSERNAAQWEHDPGRFARIAASTPLGRVTAPDDVAAVFVAVALDLTAMVGAQVVVDGGQSLALGP